MTTDIIHRKLLPKVPFVESINKTNQLEVQQKLTKILVDNRKRQKTKYFTPHPSEIPSEKEIRNIVDQLPTTEEISKEIHEFATSLPVTNEMYLDISYRERTLELKEIDIKKREIALSNIRQQCLKWQRELETKQLYIDTRKRELTRIITWEVEVKNEVGEKINQLDLATKKVHNIISSIPVTEKTGKSFVTESTQTDKLQNLSYDMQTQTIDNDITNITSKNKRNSITQVHIDTCLKRRR